MSWCKCFVLALCVAQLDHQHFSLGRLSSLLPAGERRGDGRVPKNHLRAFALALSLSLSPMAVSEIERKSGEEEWRGKKRRVVDLS